MKTKKCTVCRETMCYRRKSKKSCSPSCKAKLLSPRAADRQRRYSRDHARAKQSAFENIKIVLGCSKCGYRTSPSALQFHHYDPTTREYGISAGRFWANADTVLQELDKCVLLCSNCHYEEHDISKNFDLS
jgi:hypothetical protein